MDRDRCVASVSLNSDHECASSRSPNSPVELNTSKTSDFNIFGKWSYLSTFIFCLVWLASPRRIRYFCHADSSSRTARLFLFQLIFIRCIKLKSTLRSNTTIRCGVRELHLNCFFFVIVFGERLSGWSTTSTLRLLAHRWAIASLSFFQRYISLHRSLS